MNKLMQLFERSRNWLESGALASFLSNPVVRYDVHAGAHVVVIGIDCALHDRQLFRVLVIDLLDEAAQTLWHLDS